MLKFTGKMFLEKNILLDNAKKNYLNIFINIF